MKRLQSEKIKLNVGGQIFVTSITTLTKDPDSLLARMFGPNGTAVPEADGSYFIDRDGTYFRYVLNYLRDLTVRLNCYPAFICANRYERVADTRECAARS